VWVWCENDGIRRRLRDPRVYVEKRTLGLTSESLEEHCGLTLNYDTRICQQRNLFHSSKDFDLIQLPVQCEFLISPSIKACLPIYSSEF